MILPLLILIRKLFGVIQLWSSAYEVLVGEFVLCAASFVIGVFIIGVLNIGVFNSSRRPVRPCELRGECKECFNPIII